MYGIPGEYVSAVMTPRTDGRVGHEVLMIQGFSDQRVALEWASTVASELWACDIPDMSVREYQRMMTGRCALTLSLPLPLSS